MELISVKEILVVIAFLLVAVWIRLGSISDLLEKEEIEVDEHTGEVSRKNSWRGLGELIAFFATIGSALLMRKLFW